MVIIQKSRAYAGGNLYQRNQLDSERYGYNSDKYTHSNSNPNTDNITPNIHSNTYAYNLAPHANFYRHLYPGLANPHPWLKQLHRIFNRARVG